MVTERDLMRELRRAERNLRAAQERANNGAGGCYSESYAQAEARDRRSQATIRKHQQRIARLERELTAVTA